MIQEGLGIVHQRWIGARGGKAQQCPGSGQQCSVLGRLAVAGQPLPRSRSIQLLSSGLAHTRPQTYTAQCTALSVGRADQGGQLTGQTPILRTASQLPPPLQFPIEAQSPPLHLNKWVSDLPKLFLPSVSAFPCFGEGFPHNFPFCCF